MLEPHYNPKVNPEAVKLFISDKENVENSDNLLFALIGLTAPKHIEDIHAYGQSKVDKALKESLKNNKYLSADFELPQLESELVLTIEQRKLNCWLGQHDVTNPSCYSSEELNKLADDYRVLLDRYESLRKYKQYDGFFIFNRNGLLEINLSKLYFANINNKLKKAVNTDFEFQKIIHSVEHYTNLLKQPANWPSKAVILVLYGWSLNLLEDSIHQHSDIAARYNAEILNALNSAELNLADIYREEFEGLNFILCLDEKLGVKTTSYCSLESEKHTAFGISYALNSYYEMYLETLPMMSLGIEKLTQFCDEEIRLSKWQLFKGMIFHLPIVATYTTYKLHIGGHQAGCELTLAHKKNLEQGRRLKADLATLVIPKRQQ